MTIRQVGPSAPRKRPMRTMKQMKEYLDELEAEEQARREAELAAAALDDTTPLQAGSILQDMQNRREGRKRRHPVGDVGIVYRVETIGLPGYSMFTFDHRSALKKAQRLRNKGMPVVIVECALTDVKTWRHA